MYRIGLGSDIHRLIPDRKLILGGIEVPFTKGADAHSDGDVLLHALTDALLGSLALGDIGQHFPNSDEKWKHAKSKRFVEHALHLVNEKGYELANMDATIITEEPRLKAHLPAMCENIAQLLKTELANVSIKAGTNERCDSIGNGEALSAQVIVLLKKI